MSVLTNREIKRQKAIKLRKKGYTYKEIIKHLHIAKSTLSYWVKSDLKPIEERRIKLITAKKGKDKVIQNNKERSLKIKIIENKRQQIYANQISKIDKEKLFWLGMGLYLAEGAKTDRWKAIFYNSNPELNKLMIRFFREICNIPNEKIHIQLVLHEGVSEEKARTFWSKLLNIPEIRFYRASYAKSRASKGKRPKNRLPFGTIQLSVSGKETANMVRGWMLGIRKMANLTE